MDRDILKAVCIISVFMLLSAALTYELPYNEDRVKQGLSIVSAFGIGALMFNEEEQTDDNKHGLSSVGLWLGAVSVICFCYTMRVIDDNSNGVGLAVAVFLNFVFDCSISTTPRWTYAAGADNIALVVVLAARAHNETFSLRRMYVYLPPFVYLLTGYIIAYRRFQDKYTLHSFARTLFTGAKQGIVAYTIAIELASHIMDTIDDHATTYAALCVLSVAGPFTNWVAGAQAQNNARVTPQVEMGCVPPAQQNAVLY